MAAMIDLPFAIAGAVTGLVVGLTGVGGGALMTPILLLFFGIAPVTAIATDLWFAAITKLVGAVPHQQRGQVDWQVVRRLWAGSLPVALGVVLVVMSLGTSVGKLEWLTQAVGGLVLVTGLGLLLSPLLSAWSKRRRISQPQQFLRWQPTMTVVSGGILGVCVALTSVGAGALGSVALKYLYPLRMTPHRLVATDLVHAIPLAVVAGMGYLAAGWVDWRMLVSLLAGSLPTVLLGAWLAARMNGRWLQTALALVLVAAGLKTLLPW
jgi:uncharacterized membrane protein YfcA